MRARYGVSVVILKSNPHSVTVIAVPYVISWKIGPRYIGTWLYIRGKYSQHTDTAITTSLWRQNGIATSFCSDVIMTLLLCHVPVGLYLSLWRMEKTSEQRKFISSIHPELWNNSNWYFCVTCIWMGVLKGSLFGSGIDELNRTERELCSDIVLVLVVTGTAWLVYNISLFPGI